MVNKEPIKSIDDYIKDFPQDIQDILIKLRNIINNAAPEATETISYQMPTFKLNENLVHFAAYKNHIGFYPTPSAIIKFKDRISEYKYSKGAIQFPLNKPMPYDLIKEIVEYRVKSVKNLD